MNKRKCIGILGGGQLARMSAYQAYKLGFDIAILEKTKNSPAGQLTHNEFVGWVDDHKLMKQFEDMRKMMKMMTNGGAGQMAKMMKIGKTWEHCLGLACERFERARRKLG